MSRASVKTFSFFEGEVDADDNGDDDDDDDDDELHGDIVDRHDSFGEDVHEDGNDDDDIDLRFLPLGF
jgi:hypothetical protein